MIFTAMWNLKNYISELIYKIEIRLRQKTNLWLPKGKSREGKINQEFESSRYKLLYVK